VTPAARREGVRFLVARGISPRRACVLRPLYRSPLDYQPRPDRQALLAAQVHALALRHPRSGDRRGWALLRRRGQQVPKKHGPRLWTRAKLQVPQGRRTPRPARMAMVPVQAVHPGHVWTDDSLFDQWLNGVPRKVLPVMEECTREGLAMAVATSLPAQRVLAVLEQLVARHGGPQFVRSDHGPECIALVVRTWLAQHPMRTWSSDPGRPWQNG